MNIKSVAVYNRIGRTRKRDGITLLHRAACIWGVLVTLYCLFYCWLSFSNALQDLRKYGALGVPHSLGYYLEQNAFGAWLLPFLCAAGEFSFYFVLHRRMERVKPLRGGVWIFAGLLVIHTALWLHAHSLPLPGNPPYDPVYFSTVRYRWFAKTTVSPPVFYFIVYTLGVRKFRGRSR